MSTDMIVTVNAHNPEVVGVDRIERGTITVRLGRKNTLHPVDVTLFLNPENALEFVTDLIEGLDTIRSGFRQELLDQLTK